MVAAPDHVHILGAGEGGAVAASLARLLARPGKVPTCVVACLETAVVALDQFLVTPKERVMNKYSQIDFYVEILLQWRLAATDLGVFERERI